MRESIARACRHSRRPSRDGFRLGAVPALLPFFTVKFDLSYTLDRRPDARRADLVVARAAAVRALVGPPRGALAAARRARARRRSASVSPPSRRATPCCSCSCSSPASASPRSTPRERSSPCSRAARSGRAACRSSTSAATPGYALGPIIVTPLVLWLGLGPGGLLAPLPRARRSLAVLGALPYLARPRPRARRGHARGRGRRTTSGRCSSSRA